MKSSGRRTSRAWRVVSAQRSPRTDKSSVCKPACRRRPGAFSATYFDMDRPASLGLALGAFVRDVEKAEGNYDPDIVYLAGLSGQTRDLSSTFKSRCITDRLQPSLAERYVRFKRAASERGWSRRAADENRPRAVLARRYCWRASDRIVALGGKLWMPCDERWHCPGNFIQHCKFSLCFPACGRIAFLKPRLAHLRADCPP